MVGAVNATDHGGGIRVHAATSQEAKKKGEPLPPFLDTSLRWDRAKC